MENNSNFIKIKFSNGEELLFPDDCVAYKDKSGFCSCKRCLDIIEATRKHNKSNSSNHI